MPDPRQPTAGPAQGPWMDILGELRHNAGSVLEQALDPARQMTLGPGGNAVATGLDAITGLAQAVTVPLEQHDPGAANLTPEHVRQRGDLLGSILGGLVPLGGAAGEAESVGSRLIKQAEDVPLHDTPHLPYTTRGGQGTYNPSFFTVEPRTTADGKTVHELVPRSHHRGSPQHLDPNAALKDPDVLYKGLSHEEYEQFKRTGQIHQPDEHGHTEFTWDMPTAEHEAHSTRRPERQASKGRPAYVVAVKHPGSAHAVDAEGAMVNVKRPIKADEVLRTFKGTAVAHEPSPSKYFGAPHTRLNWERLGQEPPPVSEKLDKFYEDFRAAHKADEERAPTEKERQYREALDREIAWGDKWVADNQHILGDKGNGWEAFQEAQKQPGYKALERQTELLKPTENERLNKPSEVSRVIQKHLPPGWTTRRVLDDSFASGIITHPVYDENGYMVMRDASDRHGTSSDDWARIILEGRAPRSPRETYQQIMKEKGLPVPANDTSYDIVDQMIREANRREPPGQVLQFPKPGSGMIGQ